MKYVSYLLSLLLLFSFGCKKENDIDFKRPSISLGDIEIISSNECQVSVILDLGVGYKKHKVRLELEDFTDIDNPPVSIPVSIDSKEQNQEITVKLNVPDSNHDYMVRGIMETQNNYFETGRKTIMISKPNHRYDIGIPYIFINSFDYGYPFIEGDIHKIAQPGEYFLIKLENQYGGFQIKDIKVTLNNSIPLKSDFPYDYVGSNDESIGATLPDNLPPGDYSVQLYLDGGKWDVQGKIRILPWKSNIVETDSPLSFYSMAASFQIGNTTYYLQWGDHDIVESKSTYKMCAYQFDQNKWQTLNDWVYFINASPLQAISTNGKGYCILQVHNGGSNDYYCTCSLWCYSPDLDQWNYITDYPGQGSQGFVLYSNNDYIYMGGGTRTGTIYNETETATCDFWRYNFQTNEWEQLHNLPFMVKDRRTVNSSCTDGERSYTFLSDRTLWSYHFATNQWKQEGTLLSGTYNRYNSPIVTWKGKVCMVGSYYGYEDSSSDVQLYDPSTSQWTLMEVFHSSIDIHYTPAIRVYNEAIYVGPIRQFSYNVYDPPKPRFIQIIPQ